MLPLMNMSGATGPAASPDGKTVYTVDHSLCAVEAASGKKVWESDLVGKGYSGPVLSPDGKTVYITIASDHAEHIASAAPGNLYAVDASTGKKTWAFAPASHTGDQTPQYANSALSPDGETVFVANLLNVSTRVQLFVSGAPALRWTDLIRNASFDAPAGGFETNLRSVYVLAARQCPNCPKGALS